MEPASKEITTVTAVETAADRTAQSDDLAVLAPAAAAALFLLADAVKRHGADPDTVVQALKDARVNHAFADVLDAASTVVMDTLEDPYEFDGRLHADNLAGAAAEVRRAFNWL